MRQEELTLNGGKAPQKYSGRPLVYSKEELKPHIEDLWEKMSQPGSKRLKAALPDWLPSYKECPAHLRLQISKISVSTLDRYLKEVRQNNKPSKGLSTTSPAC